MAVKMALAVGLFIVFCVSPGLNASQVVPDGLVYTEVEKTLVQGVQGVLTCRFYGDPVAVYWRKGHDPDDLSLIVVWYDGEVSGPRFDDGSCDVDENYSLIINNVSAADAGRMYCTVSNNKGPVMKNYTDILVLDTAITTNQRVTMQLRTATYYILQCTVHINARRVSWKKETTSSANESLVVMGSNKYVSERSGSGYDEGMYNITQDYSLVIKGVQVHHEGLYICEATDDNGISFRNHTFLNVVAQPLEPFPTIQECLNAEQHDSNYYCTLVAESGMTLTCQAVKYYPSINLVFLYGSRVLKPSDTREWNNTDGTKNKTITIATGGNKELYTCVAFNTPGTNGNKSTSVLLHGDEQVKSTLVIILVLVAALILISSVVYFIWRRIHPSHPPVPPVNNSSSERSDQNQELEVSYTLLPGSDKHQELQGTYTSVSPASYIPDSRNDQHEELEGSYTSVQSARFISDSQSDQSQELEDFKVKYLSREKLQALEQRTDEFLMKHLMAIDFSLETTEAEKIVSENRIALFDTHKMITDWQQRPTSTSQQYLRALQASFSEEDESDHIWPSKEELKSMSRHLTQESMKEVCNELKIAYNSDDANDEGKRFDSLCEWRSKASDTHLEYTLKQLSSVLESISLKGLLPTLRGPYIYTAELVDLAFSLLIHGLLPITKELGINNTKLASYRPAFHPSHLEMGTIKLLLKFIASMERQLQDFAGDDCKRSTIFTLLVDHHYQNVNITGLFEYGMSYEELCSISEAMHQSAATSGMIPEELGNLQDVLQLTDQDIADHLHTSQLLTAYALFKMWKEKPRPSGFNYRAALAHELRIIQMPDLADEIIAGTYFPDQTSLAFIEDMVRGLNQDQTRSLGKLLQLNGDNEHWHTTTPLKEISQQIYHKVAGWSNGTNDSWIPSALGNVNEWRNATAEESRDLNNKLVEHGFLDLAREIMIVEQQLGCKSLLDSNHDDDGDINNSNDISSSSDSIMVSAAFSDND